MSTTAINYYTGLPLRNEFLSIVSTMVIANAGDGNDFIYAGVLNDYLVGGTGIDVLWGYHGDDTVWGDLIGDPATGDPDQILGGLGNDALFGGGGDDVINGEQGSDGVWGQFGNDILWGGEGADRIHGGEGNDLIYGGTADADLTLPAITVNYRLTDDAPYGPAQHGGYSGRLAPDDAGADYLDGGEGNDRIFGQGGNDTIKGGDGHDFADGGDGNDVIHGGDGNDHLYGQAGADLIRGGEGNDRVYGGDGNDTLYGGWGKDAFYFDSAPNKTTNVDRIEDFNVKDDVLRFDNAVYTKIGKDGALKAAAFWTGNKAHDSNDRFIYNKKNGALYYDSDGTGSAAQIKVATLDKNLALTHKDFFVV